MLKFAACLLPILGWLALAGPARSEMGGVEKLKAAQSEFRVCAAPDNLPFTNQAGEGFDNKIAELLAKADDKPLTYFWWPARRGFINHSLGRWNCDVVLGVPAGYELTATTKPYYCSTYVEVRLANPGPETAGKPVGVVVSTPPLDLLLRHGSHPIVYIPTDPDSTEYSGRLLPDLLSGRLSAAYVWGPIAGYFAREAPGKITISPLNIAAGDQDIRFTFPMAVGVRHGDRARLATLNSELAANESRIREILVNAGVPLIDNSAQCMPPQREASSAPRSPAQVDAADSGAIPAQASKLIRVADAPAAQAPQTEGGKITCNGPLTMDEVTKLGGGAPSANQHPYTVKDGKVDDTTYNGWIRFSVSCQQCHGPGGIGSAIAPDLAQALKSLDKKQFEAILTCGLKGNLGIGVMPAWEGNPNVMPYLNDIWAYLKARSDGALAAGRPEKLAEANKSSSASQQQQ